MPCFIPSGKMTWRWDFFSGYDGQGDWNVYSRYMNLDGGMAQVSTLFSGFLQTYDECLSFYVAA